MLSDLIGCMLTGRASSQARYERVLSEVWRGRSVLVAEAVPPAPRLDIELKDAPGGPATLWTAFTSMEACLHLAGAFAEAGSQYRVREVALEDLLVEAADAGVGVKLLAAPETAGPWWMYVLPDGSLDLNHLGAFTLGPEGVRDMIGLTQKACGADRAGVKAPLIARLAGMGLNREAALRAGRCACYRCLYRFESDQIKSYEHAGGEREAAICPRCGLATVLSEGAAGDDEALTRLQGDVFGGLQPRDARAQKLLFEALRARVDDRAQDIPPMAERILGPDSPEIARAAEHREEAARLVGMGVLGGVLAGEDVDRLSGGEWETMTRFEIPEGVWRVENEAFEDCAALELVTVPGTVRQIGTGAFRNCKSLRSIELPEGLEEIWSFAFERCEALETVRLGSSLGLLGFRAFDGCKNLRSASLPEGLREIQSGAFRGCSALTEVRLPEGLTELGESVFEGCSALERAWIPASLTRIVGFQYRNWVKLAAALTARKVAAQADGVFEGCGRLAALEVSPDNPAYASADGLLIDRRDGRLLWRVPAARGSATIPAGVRILGSAALSRDPDLTALAIPEGVEFIDDRALADCRGLERVVLPQSLRRIGEYAFYGCEALREIDIPDGVTEIGQCAFCGCLSLERVRLGAGISEVALGTFSTCRSLKAIELPAGVKRVGEGAFLNCEALEKVSMPEGPVEIGEGAFEGCGGVLGIGNRQ